MTHASQDEMSKWHVTVQRADGSHREFCVDHFVLAAGPGGGMPSLPNIPDEVMTILISVEMSAYIMFRRCSRAKHYIHLHITPLNATLTRESALLGHVLPVIIHDSSYAKPLSDICQQLTTSLLIWRSMAQVSSDDHQGMSTTAEQL